jgi:peptidyl-prolyl cis-trans isomerase-like 2
MKGAAKHDNRGVVAMANKGAGTNGSESPFTSPVDPTHHILLAIPRSQFYITFQAAPHLDKKHTVFGKLVGGEDVLDTLERLPRKEGTERPAKLVRITEVIMYVCIASILRL